MQKIHEIPIWMRVILPIVVGFVLIGIGDFILHNQKLSWDFRNNLWAPAYLLAQGRDPYDLTEMYEVGAAVWMPTAVGAASLLGYLSEQMATNIWIVLNVLAYLVIIPFSIPHKKPAPLWLGIGLFCILLFPPIVTTVRIGQIGIIKMLLWFLASVALNYKRPGIAGLLMALSTAKPQLLVLVAPAMLVMAYRTGGWSLLKRFVLYGLLWSCVLTIPLWISYPGWVPSFIRVLQNNPIYAQPATLYQLRILLGVEIGSVIWFIFYLGVLAAVLHNFWHTQNYRGSLIWTFALTTIVAPYTWTWDFVLLVPAILWVLLSSQAIGAKILITVGYVVLWMLFIYVRVNVDNSDVVFWWVPWAFIALLIATWKMNPAHEVKQHEPDQ